MDLDPALKICVNFFEVWKKNDSYAVELAKILLKNGASLHNFAYYQDGYMPLHLSLIIENQSLFYFFIQQGADVNLRTQDSKYSAFILAAKLKKKVLQRVFYPMALTSMRIELISGQLFLQHPVFQTKNSSVYLGKRSEHQGLF